MPKNKMPDWLTPELIGVVGKATAEFTANLIMIIRARVNGEKIPDDALEKRIRSTLKQATALELAREIRRARGEDV